MIKCKKCGLAITWVEGTAGKFWNADATGSWCLDESSHEPPDRMFPNDDAAEGEFRLLAYKVAEKNDLPFADAYQLLLKREIDD